MEPILHNQIIMETRCRIHYQAAGFDSKAIPVKIDFPFNGHLEEIAGIDTSASDSERIADLAGEESVYHRAARLSELLSISTDPGRDILYILARAAAGDRWGLELLFTLFLAEPSPAEIIYEYSGFENLRRLMKYISKKIETGEGLSEREQLFKRKVELLPISHPLPGSDSEQNALENWQKGVSRAMSDPDNNLEEHLRERIYAEMEAGLIRVNRIISRIDPSTHRDLAASLINMAEQINWSLKALRETPDMAADSSLCLKTRLSGHWEDTLRSLEERAAGVMVKEMFRLQEEKAHSYPRMKAGTAVVTAVLSHPQVSYRKPDILSSLLIFLESAGRDSLKFVFPSSRVDAVLFALQGFNLDENILTVELDRISRAQFLDNDGLPLEFNWQETIEKGSEDDYKFMILSNLDNSSFLKHILENPKLASKPGVVSLISLRCKSADVLTKIASRRDLYTGFANKDVPRNLLMNPARIPVTSLRKFVHVRYIDKMTLRQMANGRGKGGQVREEIRREIEKYLNSK